MGVIRVHEYSRVADAKHNQRLAPQVRLTSYRSNVLCFRFTMLIGSNSAILAILGIGDAGHHVITRTAALLALVSALISLGFGGAYTIRFSSLKTPQRGLVWLLVRNPDFLSYRTLC